RINGILGEELVKLCLLLKEIHQQPPIKLLEDCRETVVEGFKEYPPSVERPGVLSSQSFACL
ncbi:hypothetical protein, partial [Thermogemmatispora sp.]|uniref:hypothetical protein n=1 Tax=Thermogemmatispora sp. TaxID=1968838 RepID=UPI002ACC2DE4